MADEDGGVMRVMIDENNPLKSVHSRVPAYVTFVNRTPFPVDVIWRDFQGRNVRYREGLPPSRRYHMNTFYTHPWRAWISQSQVKLNLNGQRIYQPVPWQGEQNRTLVCIDLPVRPLLKLCIHKIRSLIAVNDVDKLEVPATLHRALKKRKREDIQEHS